MLKVEAELQTVKLLTYLLTPLSHKKNNDGNKGQSSYEDGLTSKWISLEEYFNTAEQLLSALATEATEVAAPLESEVSCVSDKSYSSQCLKDFSG